MVRTQRIQRIQKVLRVTGPNKLYFYCILLGLVMGLISVGLAKAIHLGEFYVLGSLAGVNTHTIDPWWGHGSGGTFRWGVVIVPILGGLIVSLVARVVPEIMAAGTNDLVGAFHEHEGQMRGRVVPGLALASIVGLSTGASGGKEGPTAVIGGAVGSVFSRWTGLGARARRTLLLAGAAAGLGGIFRAPLGGAITAVEIPYREDFESDALIPCIIASITAYIVSTLFWGQGHLFKIESMMIHDYRELWIYAVLGLVCVLAGRMFLWTLRMTQRLVSKIPIPRTWMPVMGGAFLGLLGCVFPSALGTGFDLIQEAIHGQLFDGLTMIKMIKILVAFIVLKMVATSVTVGSGFAGGLFGPSFVMGGMTGALVGNLAHAFFPNIVVSAVPFIVVGMGAFFAGVAHAPLATLIMVVELTGSYELFPAILIAVAIGIVFSSKESMYSKQQKNKFDSPAHLWDMKKDVLQNIRVRDVQRYLRTKDLVAQNVVMADLQEKARELHASDFIVVDERQQCRGYISLRHAHVDHLITKLIIVSEVMETEIETGVLEENLSDILEKILKGDMDKLAIVDSDQTVIGYIRYRDILDIYTSEVRYLKKKNVHEQ